jgi:predicted metal-dependent hydrolase
MFLALAILEYVVAHEVVHLLHRHHGDAFWETLGSVMPDWRERKVNLESWESSSLRSGSPLELRQIN